MPRVLLLRLGLSSKVNPPLPHIGVSQASCAVISIMGLLTRVALI